MKFLRKLWRLLVDDVLLAVSVFIWCLACALLANRLPPRGAGAVLVAGLALALAVSVARGAAGAARPHQ